MHNAKFFTKLDASGGYWQIKVDQDSSKLLVFSTLLGRLRFKGLPYGIHSASEISQQDIEEIIEGCKWARNSQDDIIIWGSSQNQLDIRSETTGKWIILGGIFCGVKKKSKNYF